MVIALEEDFLPPSTRNWCGHVPPNASSGREAVGDTESQSLRTLPGLWTALEAGQEASYVIYKAHTSVQDQSVCTGIRSV